MATRPSVTRRRRWTGCVEPLDVPQAWDRNSAAGIRRGIVERTLVGPTHALVEPPGSGVAGHNGQPCPLVAIRPHETLGLAEQSGGDAGPTMTARDVDLFHLVIDDHDEARDCAVDDEDHGVADPLGGSRRKGLQHPSRHELVWDVAQVTVAPSVAPDRGDGLGVIGGCASKFDAHVAGRHPASLRKPTGRHRRLRIQLLYWLGDSMLITTFPIFCPVSTYL